MGKAVGKGVEGDAAGGSAQLRGRHRNQLVPQSDAHTALAPVTGQW